MIFNDLAGRTIKIKCKEHKKFSGVFKRQNEKIKIEEGYQKLKEILHIDTPPDNEPSQINTTSTDEEIVEDYNENVS